MPPMLAWTRTRTRTRTAVTMTRCGTCMLCAGSLHLYTATATSKMSTWLPRWLLFVGQRSSESFWAGLDHFVVWRRFARLHAARCSTERRVLGRSTIWRSTRTSGSTPARRPYFGSIRSGSHRAWSSHFCTARLGLRGRCAAADQFCCLHCIAVTTIHQVLCVRAGCCPTRS